MVPWEAPRFTVPNLSSKCSRSWKETRFCILTPNYITYNLKLGLDTFLLMLWAKSEHASQKIINKCPHFIGSSKASHSGRDVPNVWVRQLRYASVLRGRKENGTEKIFFYKYPQNASKCFKSDYSTGVWIFGQPRSKISDYGRPYLAHQGHGLFTIFFGKDQMMQSWTDSLNLPQCRKASTTLFVKKKKKEAGTEKKKKTRQFLHQIILALLASWPKHH